MRLTKKLFINAVLMIAFGMAQAQDCGVPLSVITLEEGDVLSEAIEELIRTRLISIASENGDAVEGSSRFFIAAKLNHLSTDVLPGPPMQTAIVSTLTLYAGDAEDKTIFSSTSLEIRGVGNSEQRALTSALKPLNASNKKIRQFMRKASEKIVAYYDKKYPSMIAKAERLAATRQYDAAVYTLFSIPECCIGYEQAAELGLKYYEQLTLTEDRRLLDTARAFWYSSPDSEGASKALAILLTIPSNSASYSEAKKLENEIGATMKDNKKFETRTKYNDALDIKKRQIQAASAVGVAYGRGQQPTTTNINWIR